MAERTREQLLADVQHLRSQVEGYRSDHHLAAIVESSDDAILSTNLEGVVLSWNRGAERLYGFESAEIIGNSICLTIPEDRFHDFHRILQSIHHRKRVPPFETIRRRRDGTFIPISLTVAPVFDHEGNVIGASAIARDLREQIQLQTKAAMLDVAETHAKEQRQILQRLEMTNRELSRSKQNLERINRELEAFGYTISHDLRDPLRAIRGFAEILLRRQRNVLDDSSLRYLENIVEAGAQLEELIENLLTYSQLGRRGVDHVAVPLDTVFARLLRDQSPMIEATDAHIQIADPLPMVWGDTTLLYQIFSNLFLNAITYHREDTPPVIHIDWSRDADDIVVKIRDNGIGIRPEHHAKIFEIFQRLHTKEQYPGTGIGLGIVQKAVELLEGRVWLESELETGTTFFIQLPAVAALP